MAGGYASGRGIGIRIGERGAAASSGGERRPTPAQGGLTAAPRRLPFVFVDVGGRQVPGLVVEQRRGPEGWIVLVAMTHVDEQGRPGLHTDWFEPERLRPASLSPSAAGVNQQARNAG